MRPLNLLKASDTSPSVNLVSLSPAINQRVSLLQCWPGLQKERTLAGNCSRIRAGLQRGGDGGRDGLAKRKGKNEGRDGAHLG